MARTSPSRPRAPCRIIGPAKGEVWQRSDPPANRVMERRFVPSKQTGVPMRTIPDPQSC
jgi:hypothetical protein